MKWFIPVASALLGAHSASKQRRQSRRIADRQFEEQQRQQALLEEQKQAYRDIVFTNPDPIVAVAVAIDPPLNI